MKKNILLMLYALISTSFIFIFMGVIVITDFSSLLSFPVDVFVFFKELILNNKKVDFIALKKLTIFLLFYIVLIKLSRKIYFKKIKSMGSAIKKELFPILASTILSTAYLLSAVGKTIGFASFSKNIEQYPYYFNQLPHILIGIEYVLSIGFITLAYRKFLSKLSIMFLVIITLVYVYGFFILGIQECVCFGSIDILNTDDIIVVVGKNVILTLLSFYTLKKVKRSVMKIGVPLGIVFSFSFFNII